ncbi:DUF6678 family protein [Billgrantia desiderata]|uniref:DUF6678 family protein n=1 Tax=Billgrantia desiderata TaxID=52021 RepID=UPI003F33D8B4
MTDLPGAASVPRGLNEERLDKEIARAGLVGAANNTKWNELIAIIRNEGLRPSYRSKWINGYVSEWDVEWCYHLPFPFKGVMWLDISTNVNGEDLTSHYVAVVDSIGLDYQEGASIVRVFGYLPRDTEGIND